MKQRESRVRASMQTCLGLLCLLGVAEFALADSNIYVSPDGDDANSGQEQSPIQTLTEAVVRANVSSDSTNIFFAPGSYTAEFNMFLSYPATLTGPGAELQAVFIGDNIVHFHDIAIRSKGLS